MKDEGEKLAKVLPSSSATNFLGNFVLSARVHHSMVSVSN